MPEHGRRIQICEVGPRDGLQMESGFVATEDKIALIDALSETGVPRIEATSFVSPKAIPQLRDAEAVMAGIRRVPGVEYMVLVPNAFGARRAVAAGVDLIHVVASATEAHNLANVNMTRKESLATFAQVVEVAGAAGVPVMGSIACTFGCPYQGDVPTEDVLWLAEEYRRLGMREICIGDPTGMAFPNHVKQMVQAVRERCPDVEVTLHFHNTRGAGLANVMAGIEVGVTLFDASVGGLGGCPYAPGATGNICTEDLVQLLHQMGIETGVDLPSLVAIARRAEQIVGHKLDGQVMRAGTREELTPKPSWLFERAAARGVAI